jgi:hypothetical protein
MRSFGMTTTLKVSILVAGLAALSAAAGAMAAGVSGASRQGEWKSLFDGVSTSGWRGYKQASAPASWKAVDGLLVLEGKAGDLVTEEEFGDFELSLEWKIKDGGNSGIFYRVTEEPASIWHHAIEYQILDNARHKDGADTKTSTGACYALYGPSSDVTRSPGQWNETRIVARGAHVEHWLNGTKLSRLRQGAEGTHRPSGSRRLRGLPEHQDPEAHDVTESSIQNPEWAGFSRTLGLSDASCSWILDSGF